MIGVIIVAAGDGTRLGHGRPKALVEIDGRSILERALAVVFESSEALQVVVVAPPRAIDEATAIARTVAGVAADHVSIVPGGSSRQSSVVAGLAALDGDVDVVLVHDAARAFTPLSQFTTVVEAVRSTAGGVIPVLPVTDTIKRVDENGTVQATVDRSELAAVQTPQGFPRRELQAAYARATQDYTDDAAVFTAAGGTVTVVDGHVSAFKITTAWDLRRAESMMRPESTTSQATAPTSLRTGVGIDVHAFDADAPLWLGALHWPGEPGLAGHSDGDALCHALCDAVLSATGLGDIGSRFGTDDPRLSGAHGDVFLTETMALVRSEGWEVVNIAAQVVALRPKFAPRRLELEQRLSALIGAPVSVSATTSDGLGFTGRGDGVAVLATALVTRGS